MTDKEMEIKNDALEIADEIEVLCEKLDKLWMESSDIEESQSLLGAKNVFDEAINILNYRFGAKYGL
jgi:hypothetical protein